MNSYQKLKMQLEEAKTELIEKQRIINIFKNAITICEKTEMPRFDPKANNNFDFVVRQTIAIQKNRTDELIKRELTNWVINNIDKEVIERWLKYVKKED